MTKVLSYGFFGIFLGIILLLLSIVLEKSYQPLPLSSEVIVKLLENLGIAIFTIGVVGIIIDFPDWQKYFQERIADTIIQQEYLKRLEKPELINLQVNTLRAFFKADDIAREGSFLDFFQQRLQAYIGAPFREDADAVYVINHSNQPNFYQIDQTLSYKCRKVADSIQDQVQWGGTEDQELDIQSLRIKLRVPSNFFQSPEFRTSFPHISNQEKIYDIADNDSKEDNTARLEKWKTGCGYDLSLRDYKHIDGLHVEINIRYLWPINRTITWRMGHVTRSLRLTVDHPKDLKIHLYSLCGIEEIDVIEHEQPGFYKIEYDSWILPHTGIAFDFTER